jgi:outer membrane receptor for ferrienterochelin and colicin
MVFLTFASTIHPKVRLSGILYFLLICLGSPATWAQKEEVSTLLEMSLEELMKLEVTVASKTSESISDAPGIITIISRKEIDDFAESKLGDILNRVISTSLLSANILTNNIIDFRGQSFTPYNNHTLFLINGRPIRDPISGGLNATLLSAFPVNTIDRIEIIRGPGSVLYGSCAYSGVVNIITRSIQEENEVAGAELKYGSFNTKEINAYASINREDLQAILGFKNYISDGQEFDFVDYNDVYKQQRFWEKGAGIITSINYKGLSFNAGIMDQRPYALGGKENAWSEDWGDKEQHSSIFADIGYQYEWSPTSFTTFNITNNRHTWQTDLGKVMEADDFMGELNFRFIPTDKWNLLLGCTFGSQIHASDYFEDGTQYYSSMYGQADYLITSKLKLILGLQFNKIQGIGGNLSPRVGAIYDIDAHNGLKLLYGQAFRKGYPLETSFNIPQLLGNPELQPELINTLEAQYLYHSSNIQMAITGFYSHLFNIVYRTLYDFENNYLHYSNGPKHDSWGAEFESKINISPKLLVMAAASYQTNKNDQGLMNAALHPNWMIKGGLIYTTKHIDIGVYNSSFSRPYEVGLLNPDVAVVNPEAQAYNLLSAKLTYNIGQLHQDKPMMKISMAGQNLLGQYIRYPEFTSKGVNTLLPLRNGAYFELSLAIGM